MEDKILISSFSVKSSHQLSSCQSGKGAFTKVFTLLDFNGNSLDVESFAFDDFYSTNYLSNTLDLDFLINPINYNNTNTLNQAYYTPKGITKTNYLFESVGLNEEVVPFGINNYTLHPVNITDNNCNIYCSDNTEIRSNIQYNNFSGSFGVMTNSNLQILTKDLNAYNYLYCNPAKPMNRNEVKNGKSLEPISNTDIIIYPNPSDGYITIENDILNNNSEYYLKIIGIDGKILIEKNIRQRINRVNISSLASGTYLILIKQNNETILTKKLIKI